MIKEGLKLLVIEEAMKLRQVATPLEIENLNFDTINSAHTKKCIYGQMTGDCFSKRSTEILNQCAVPYSTLIYKYIFTHAIRFKYDRENVSPIEFYIHQTGAKCKVLIDFIKGKIPTLTPDML